MKSFHAISLPSFLLKTLERRLDRFLREILVRYPLQTSQHAFQAGKSTETSLQSLVIETEGNMQEKQYALAMFTLFMESMGHLTQPHLQ